MSKVITTVDEPQGNRSLPRVVGIFGATMMGLGSIVGTGIFVGIGQAAGCAGSTVIAAIMVAAVVAFCNGMSSAQLAAVHPVSGGTYEYGYRWLTPSLGFTAGWMFLWAKSASAATAALGFASYFLNILKYPSSTWQIAIALSAILVLTYLVKSGIRRGHIANVIILSATLGALAIFVMTGLPTTLRNASVNLAAWYPVIDSTSQEWKGFLEACALMFVAYTGYGRIATLGEEIHNPRRNIPISILVTLLVSMLLYVSVSIVAIGTVGAAELSAATHQQAAPLEIVASTFDVPYVRIIVAVGAATAMLGVLLNLLLGLSRVLLAMGRRGDVPSIFGKLDEGQTTPRNAVLCMGFIVGCLALVGDVRTTWSFSAFTVLIYYALTNLAALRLAPQERLVPRVIPAMGLLSCLFLAFWVEMKIWIAGLILIVCGNIWHQAARRIGRNRQS